MKVPMYKTAGAAGFDFQANIAADYLLEINELKALSTGIKMSIPFGLYLAIVPRSGLALKQGLTVLNSPGTIDSDYRGEIQILLKNHGNKQVVIEPGMRIAQGILCDYKIAGFEVVGKLDDTIRGSGGFGSTGHG